MPGNQTMRFLVKIKIHGESAPKRQSAMCIHDLFAMYFHNLSYIIHLGLPWHQMITAKQRQIWDAPHRLQARQAMQRRHGEESKDAQSHLFLLGFFFQLKSASYGCAFCVLYSFCVIFMDIYGTCSILKQMIAAFHGFLALLSCPEHLRREVNVFIVLMPF